LSSRREAGHHERQREVEGAVHVVDDPVAGQHGQSRQEPGGRERQPGPVTEADHHTGEQRAEQDQRETLERFDTTVRLAPDLRLMLAGDGEGARPGLTG
jgi:hypothetical protein